jgi:hypothetical protein
MNGSGESFYYFSTQCCVLCITGAIALAVTSAAEKLTFFPLAEPQILTAMSCSPHPALLRMKL